MKYALSTLSLWLPESLRALVERRAGGCDPMFEDVRWIQGGAPPDNPGFLYIAAPDSPAPPPDSGLWVLAEEGTACAGGQRMVFPKSSAQALYDRLHEAFYQLNRWVIDLDTAVLRGQSIQTLLDLSGALLRNPIVLFDTAFRVVAATGNITEQDAPLYDTVRSGMADPSTILMLQTIHRSPFYPLGKSFLYQSTTEIRGVEELFVHLYDENSLLMARLNVCCRETAASPGFLHLLLILLDRIERALRQHPPGIAFRDLDDYFFRQLIEGNKMPEQVAEALAIPVEGEFIVLSPWMEGYDLQKTYNISAQIERVIPLSRPFLYDNQLFVFLGINSRNRSLASYWEYQMQRVREIGEMLNLRIGISNQFRHIGGIGRYCAQARAAMRLSGAPGQAQWSFAPPRRYGAGLCQYDEIAVYDVAGQLIAGGTPEGVGSPVYWSMRRHDQERGTNNCAVIKAYLQHDCEARLAADQLHMHRNSVVYRVNKLAETYALDLKSPQFKLLFLLSCAADELAAGAETETGPGPA